jgi:hypothetical protein
LRHRGEALSNLHLQGEMRRKQCSERHYLQNNGLFSAVPNKFGNGDEEGGDGVAASLRTVSDGPIGEDVGGPCRGHVFFVSC